MHLPREQNEAADFLSCQKPHPGEWRLHPEVVEEIWSQYGKAEVDLFVSEDSTHCLHWFSLRERTSSLGQDALLHTWPGGLLVTCPPTQCYRSGSAWRKRWWWRIMGSCHATIYSSPVSKVLDSFNCVLTWFKLLYKSLTFVSCFECDLWFFDFYLCQSVSTIILIVVVVVVK